MKKVLSLTTLMAGAMMVFNAAAADAPKELNLGILGGQNATQQIGDNQCVKQFLDKELNVDTKLRNSSDYSGVIQGLLGGKIDLVLSMSPSSFASVYIKDPKAVDILGVLNGQFEGAVTWASMIGDYNTGYTSGAFTRMIRMDHPDLMKQIRIIWQSPLIPNGPILVSNSLPADFKAKVVTAIKKLDKDDHQCFIKAMGGKQHIGDTTLAEYQTIIDMKRELTKGDR